MADEPEHPPEPVLKDIHARFQVAIFPCLENGLSACMQCDVWDGKFTDEGLPDGQGKMIYPPLATTEDVDEEPLGDTFEGFLHGGSREGVGRYAWSCGAIYNGNYKNNMRNGHGVMEMPNAYRFEGEFVKNVFSGQGICTYANGDIYSGEWLLGKKHGQGAYFSKGYECQMVGNWKNGCFVGGKWVLNDGSSFEGEFIDSKPKGVGVHKFLGIGLGQEGEYANGKWNGRKIFSLNTYGDSSYV